jgi:hypothetical protein
MPKSRNCTSPNGYQAFLQCHAVFLKSMRMRCTSNAPCFLEIYYPFWMLRQDLIRHQFVRHFTKYEARKPRKILVPAFLRKRLRSYKFYWVPVWFGYTMLLRCSKLWFAWKNTNFLPIIFSQWSRERCWSGRWCPWMPRISLKLSSLTGKFYALFKLAPTTTSFLISVFLMADGSTTTAMIPIDFLLAHQIMSNYYQINWGKVQNLF